MNKILVIGAGAMGAAFTFPLVDNNHKVTLTEPYNKDFQKKLLKNKFHPTLKLKLSKKVFIIKFSSELLDEKWDLIVDLRSSITAYLLLTKSRKIFKGNDKFHKIIQFKNFLNTSKKISPFIWHDSTDESESKKKIKTNGPFIAVSPYSNWKEKDWAIEKYFELFKNDFFKDYTCLLYTSPSPRDRG